MNLAVQMVHKFWKARMAAWLLLLMMLVIPAAPSGRSAASVQKAPDSLSAAEFSRLSREFSEDGGYFRSDNFTSNETSYLHIVDKLKQLGASGGAYLGVGPEQNFTYIAKIRPRIAFLVDIRRQAIVQHLMYKAIFHLSPTPAQFLSRLLSRPIPKDSKDSKELKTTSTVPGANASINDLLAFFSQAPADEKTYAANLTEIRKVIEEEFKFPLSEADRTSLDYVYRSFYADGLEISYRTEGAFGSYFPTLKEIIAGTDLDGKQGNFLAGKEDYEFVRELHRKNLIIPVVGDFAGKKALSSVGEYLRKNGLTVTAFYLSNVEQYLFGNGVFAGFAENVRKLPINDKSLFIRSVAGRGPHPARMPGHRLATILQYMAVFLKDFDSGAYHDYMDLVTTHYLMADMQR
jgi:hypothetical protein